MSIASQINHYRDNGSTNNNLFYAGICKDVKPNMDRLGNREYAALVDCGPREKAGVIETKLAELVYDVGDRQASKLLSLREENRIG